MWTTSGDDLDRRRPSASFRPSRRAADLTRFPPILVRLQMAAAVFSPARYARSTSWSRISISDSASAIARLYRSAVNDVARRISARVVLP
uniref:Uncharacterized protein n=1 Tax=uncultured marine virus TaxID=186617 RepID=A0A0F7LAA6_9VIRU|nr:hypothetical protein [uncultured marine virus]